MSRLFAGCQAQPSLFARPGLVCCHCLPDPKLVYKHFTYTQWTAAVLAAAAALCVGHTNVRVVNFYYYSFPTCISSCEQCQRKNSIELSVNSSSIKTKHFSFISFFLPRKTNEIVGYVSPIWPQRRSLPRGVPSVIPDCKIQTTEGNVPCT